MNKSLRNLLVPAMLVVVSGCATSRGVLDITQEETANPVSGEAIKLVRVSDNRQFQIDPPEPDIPSLKNDEIDDPAITSRAIARKRNTFGQALGDILLPEDETVAGLVESSLTRGFRENGYRVVGPDDSDFDEAIPVEVDIEKFWGWFNPGFWEIKLKYETVIRISGPVGSFVDGKEFESQIELGFQTASGGNWLKLIDATLDALNKDIATELAESRH
jgi:hypothetical protein